MSNQKDDFKNRFNKAINIRNIKPTDLSTKTGIAKSTISHYMSGYTKPKSNKLYILAKALDVSEAWLMGFDVPMERNNYEDQTLVRFDAEFDDARDIIESAGYKISLSDDSQSDIIVKTNTDEIVACMHDYELVNKYESLQRKGTDITADALLENKEVTGLINKMNAFETQLKSLGWTYEPMGCHAIGQSIEFELKLNDNGNFTDTEDNHTISCNGKKCENCTEEESYYLFTNGEISFKVSIDDYDSFINDSQTFFKERLQQLLKKSMRQMFIENSYELKAAHNDNADNSEQQRLMAEDMKDIEENW